MHIDKDLLKIIGCSTLFVSGFVGLAIFLVSSLIEADKVDAARRQERRQGGAAMPFGATDIEEVGNGWQEFTYKGNRYLYYDSPVGYGRSIVRIELQDD